MKKIFKLLSVVIVFFISCKKTNENTIVTSADKAIIYKSNPNALDNLISEVNVAEDKSTTYYYGNFNTEGNPNSIKSISIKRDFGDSICNVIMDNSYRPQFIYFSLKNNTKLNILIKFTYPTIDSMIVNCYKYNFLNGNDTLIAQCKLKNNNNIYTGIRSYGRQLFNQNTDALSSQELSTTQLANWIVKNGIKAGITIAMTAVGTVLGASLAVTFGIPAILVYTAGAIIASNVLIGTVAQGATLNNLPNQSSYPNSPTNGQTPNPIGTPTYPNGLQIGNAYAGGLIFYFSDSSHEHGRVCATQDVGQYPWDLTNFDPQNPNIYNPPYLAGTSTSEVSGVLNTTRIIATLGSGNYAAYMCRNYRGNGYNDWSLPSKDELNLIYQNIKLTGLSSFGLWYWSSSEIDNKTVWSQRFDNGIKVGYAFKNNRFDVRASRGF